MIHLIEDHAKEADIPVRFAASKIIEDDPLILEALKLSKNELEMLEHIILQMETERGLDRSAAMADMRYSFIKSVGEKTVKKPVESKEHFRSQKIDEVLTGKYTAIPVFVGIMALIFYLTFNVIGAFLQNFLEIGIDKLTVAVKNSDKDNTANSIIELYGLLSKFPESFGADKEKYLMYN